MCWTHRSRVVKLISVKTLTTTTPFAGRLSGTVLTAFAPMVWGTTYVVTTELLPLGHPLFSGLVRALPAGLIALALTRTLPRGTWWLKAAALGVLNIGIFLPLLFMAAERLPGGVAATLGAAQPLIVAVLAVAVLRQSPSAWKFAWGIAGIVGVGLAAMLAGQITPKPAKERTL